MAKAKGSPKTGGRVAGMPNKVTTQAREAIAAFVDGNAHKLNSWLDQIAAESPKDAFNCFQSVVEYHIPKLARSELTGKDGGAIETKSLNKSDQDIINEYLKGSK